MSWDGLLKSVREAVPERVWGRAVEIARDGAVMPAHDEGDGVHLRVKTSQRPEPYDVWLWPDETDWDCDCDSKLESCLHVAAATIASSQATVQGKAAPEPKKQYKVRLRYAFSSQGDALSIVRRAVRPDGTEEPLRGTLAEADLVASRGDTQAERLLQAYAGGALSADLLRRLLAFVDREADATLDERPIRLSADPVLFRIRASDEGDGFKLGLFRPSGIDRLFRGAALVGDVLRPTSHGTLTPQMRQELVKGVTFGADQVGALVTDYLPTLRRHLPVDVQTARLPDEGALRPRPVVEMRERPHGLEVKIVLEYGDPPVARVESGIVKTLTGVIPARDMGLERVAEREVEALLGIHVGLTRILPPLEAIDFLNSKLPRFKGPVRGAVSPERFRLLERPVTPTLSVRPEAHGRSFQFDVSFKSADGEADVRAVLEAWRGGRSVVPLMDGGWAPLPADWLEVHGPVLREVLEARDAHGRVDRAATAALAELVEGTEGDVPPDLSRLRSFLEGGEGLPEISAPKGLVAELRPYQLTGFRWLRFLRDMDLHGVLADDMGLGKTVQAIAALLDAPGPHLVVAPTSVLRNWESELKRFSPGLSVALYHGPGRKLLPVDVTLTSYALLRLDLDLLQPRQWGYVVLDEAQAIKNPDSQTARAAFTLKARHRLAMTGTPVENRLEELWSEFRFLMPGFLGSRDSFRERFESAIEAGDQSARKQLRRRVQPYVLRRLKKQVAPELPPITEMVVRCEMSEPQRRIYEAMRIAGRSEVQAVLGDGSVGRNTFQILEALLRMRQACCDPSLLPGDVGKDVPSCKLDELEDLLVELVCDDHKALLFSQWTSLLDRVEPRLAKLGIGYVRLDGSTRDRQAVIDRFQDPSGPPVFLLSLKAGGTGLNLTAADYVVHLDPWWNPAVEQQATDRAHRIGQDKPVVSVRLISEGTVEERILDLQAMKRDLADAALGTEGGFIRALSAGELRSLFDAT